MPVVTGDKVYVHMPKTGGSWMSKYLMEQHDGKMIGSHGHQPSYTINKKLVINKIFWSTIRDPWSWYLSWYAHGMKAVAQQKLFAKYGNGSTEFKDVLLGAVAREPRRCPKKIGVIWSLHDEEKARAAYLGGSGGLYSWTFAHIFGDSVRTLIDTTRMAEGVQELLGVEVNQDLYPPANTRKLKLPVEPEDMFDEEMIDAVYEADKDIISLLGYEGPFSAMPDAICRL